MTSLTLIISLKYPVSQLSHILRTSAGGGGSSAQSRGGRAARVHNGEGGREVRRRLGAGGASYDSSGLLFGFRETSFQANTEQVEEGREMVVAMRALGASGRRGSSVHDQ